MANTASRKEVTCPNEETFSKRDLSQLDDREYLLNLKKRIEHCRVPLSGDLAITHRCNLKCVHCYLGPKRRDAQLTRKELNTAQFLSIIDDLLQAGCLFLLITGGEPLVRDDFDKIYRYAKTRGLLVTVFTNGTLVNDQILRVFEEFPPWMVEVSLYGATAATYEEVTGVKGSYKKCLSGIERLVERKINLTLKTVLMSLNRHEFSEMQRMAEAYGAKFRMDAEIFPRFDGNKTPIQFRIPSEEVVEKEFSDKSRFSQYKALYERFKNIPAAETLYSCGAGMTHFHIDPFGFLQPCLMVRSVRYDLSQGDFLTGWQGVMPQIKDKRATPSNHCNRCEKRILCGACPAFFELENHAEDVRSDYLCSIGQLRYRSLRGALSGGQ